MVDACTLSNLVTDQVPLLLVVILSEEAGFVRRQVHGILKDKRGNTGVIPSYALPAFLFERTSEAAATEPLAPTARRSLNFGDENNDLTSCVDWLSVPPEELIRISCSDVS